jgi:diacylglycerol kinase (ATP)
MLDTMSGGGTQLKEFSLESTHKSKGGLQRIWRATFYSFDGFRSALKHEHAFRQELLLCALLLPLALWLPLLPGERVILIASLLIVLIVELLNSAIEAVVDRVSLENHELSKRAKDFGSAAVFLGLTNVGVAWGFIAGPALAKLL